jgi:hypothetical protein
MISSCPRQRRRKSVNHSLLGAGILCCSDGDNSSLHQGTARPGLHTDQRRRQSACSSRRFQPAAGRGMTVEGRREAQECSRGYGGRVSAATDRYSTSIHRAVGKVTVAQATDQPCRPNPGCRTPRQTQKSLSFHWLRRRSARAMVLCSVGEMGRKYHGCSTCFWVSWDLLGFRQEGHK